MSDRKDIKDQIVELMNNKFRMKTDANKTFKAAFEKALDEMSDEAVIYYLNFLKRRVGYPGASEEMKKKSKNIRFSILAEMQNLIKGTKTLQDAQMEADMYRPENYLNGVSDLFKKTLKEFNMQPEMLDTEAGQILFKNLLSQKEEVAKSQLEIARLTSRQEISPELELSRYNELTVGMDKMRLPKNSDSRTGMKVYKENPELLDTDDMESRSPDETEQWSVIDLPDGKKAVMHIEGGDRYKKDGEPYTKLSLYLNVQNMPFGDKEKVPYAYTESAVRMYNNTGYKIELAVPSITKLTDATTGVDYCRKLLSDAARYPETAQILSVSHYSEKKTPVSKTMVAYYKKCDQEIVNVDGQMDKYLTTEQVFHGNYLSTTLERMFKSAETDKDLTVREYNEEQRGQIVSAAKFDSKEMKIALAEAIKSKMKEACRHEEVPKIYGVVSVGTVTEERTAKDYYLGAGNWVRLNKMNPGDTKIGFTITKVVDLADEDALTKYGIADGAKAMTIQGEWDVRDVKFPQTATSLLSEFGRKFEGNADTLAIQKYTVLDAEKEVLKELTADDIANMQKKESYVKDNLDIFSINKETEDSKVPGSWSHMLGMHMDGRVFQKEKDEIRIGGTIDYKMNDTMSVKVDIPDPAKGEDEYLIRFSREVDREKMANEILPAINRSKNFMKEGTVTTIVKMKIGENGIPSSKAELLKQIATAGQNNNLSVVRSEIQDKDNKNHILTMVTPDPRKKEEKKEEKEKVKEKGKEKEPAPLR